MQGNAFTDCFQIQVAADPEPDGDIGIAHDAVQISRHGCRKQKTNRQVVTRLRASDLIWNTTLFVVLTEVFLER